TTLVREDRRRDERVARVAIARHGGVTAAPIDPPRVDAAPPELRGREDVDEIASVARPAFDHEVEIPERADETAPRFLPRGSHRDHFRDEGVERRRYDASGGDAGVHPDARPERRIEACDPARRRDEGGVGVLGADACLDGDAPLDDLERGEALAASDPNLELDQI